MTDTEHINFLGIPVEGNINKGSDRPAQRSLSEFEPLIRALLDDDTIVEFGWDQYTPYFNDGEPCVFGANGLWVRTTTDAEASDDEDEDEEPRSETLSVEYGHPSLGKFEYEWFGDTYPREKRVVGYTGPDPDRLTRALALNDAIDSGAFDDVLLKAFGDHATITVSRTGIKVVFYEHD